MKPAEEILAGRSSGVRRAAVKGAMWGFGAAVVLAGLLIWGSMMLSQKGQTVSGPLDWIDWVIFSTPLLIGLFVFFRTWHQSIEQERRRQLSQPSQSASE
jgi:ABC-type amino acid transport system permease subunit